MATKIKKTWRMSEEALAIITAYAEKEGCNDTEALEQIIRHYATTAKGANQALAEDLLDKIEERYGKQITRIRLGIRTADINSQIILELLNTLMFYYKIPTVILRDSSEAAPVSSAEQHIKNKIENYRKINEGKKGVRF